MTAFELPRSWETGTAVLSAGNNTWPALHGGAIVATSDRGGRLQRDRTQRIALARVTP